MHEYSIVSSLVERATHEAVARPGARIKKLHVAIGEQAGVEINLQKTAFDTFKERSACDGAELDVRAVAARWQCPRCQSPIAAGALLRCPECGRPAKLIAGDEIVLERVELEVPDV